MCFRYVCARESALLKAADNGVSVRVDRMGLAARGHVWSVC